MQSASARKRWEMLYKTYYRESDPFDKKNKARITEWEAVYNSFTINPARYPTLIDFGCGSGHFALNFLKKGFEVTGMDISKEGLHILKQRAHTYNCSTKLHTVHSGLYTRLKSLEGRYDAGCMIVTYHCISNKREEQKKVFMNFIRLIKKNGKVLIMEPNPLNPLFYLYYTFLCRTNQEDGFNTRNSKKEIVISLLKESGMKDIQISYHSFLPTFLINRWNFVKKINMFLCVIPLVRNFSAFYLITAVKN